MAELRWILAGLGALAIAAIWWWSTRRTGQAPGNADLRESSVLPVQGIAPAGDMRDRAPETRGRTAELREAPARARDTAPGPGEISHGAATFGAPTSGPATSGRSISPLEPLSIRTGDFEPVLDIPVLDLSAGHESAPIDEADYIESSFPDFEAPAAPPQGLAPPAQPPAAPAPASAPPTFPSVTPAQALSPPSPAPAPPTRPPVTPTQAPLNLGAGTEHGSAAESSDPNASERQKIVTLRVCAVGDGRWAGGDLTAALESHGLAYGRYQVYHRKHADGRSIFCVASLIEPGTFDVARMPEEEFRGVSLFAVLPGPLEPLATVDALLATARDLARDLAGTVQDARGVPFSPQRIAALREDVARFQSGSSSRRFPGRDPAD